MSRVVVIGIAPGQEAFDPRETSILAEADLIVGAERHLALVGNSKAIKMPVEGRIGEAVDTAASNPDLKAVFLASGDPGFFGIAALLLAKLPKSEVEVIPAVSSLQYAFAKLGETWSDARLASLHGRSFDALNAILGAPKIGLLTDPSNTPSEIASFLIEAGWADLEMAVCSDLGNDSEKIARGCPADFVGRSFPAMNVVILLDRDKTPRPAGPGLPEELFLHPRGRITKSFVRAAALSMLEMSREGVFWDVGAGSGSVAIEAALLYPAQRVYAIEKDQEALGHIRENIKRLKAAPVTVVAGEAPEALENLPAPDRVFIGGSGGRLQATLDAVYSALKPGGVVVIAAVLAETFQAAVEWAKGVGCEADWAEMMVSRSRATGTGTRRVAQDPVTLLRLRKGGVQ